jgi:uncharacterized protein YabE (DUF348 family)
MRKNLGRAAIILTLGIATFAYGALEKHVTVRIDGVQVAVSTSAATVAGALERAGVVVDPEDKIVPSLDAGISDGSVIEVRRAKPVILLLDGEPRRVIVTGLTIAEVLEEMKLRGTRLDSVHPSRSSRVEPGMTISYERAEGLTVVHDGRAEQVITNASTVARLLRELGIKLGKQDRVIPPLSARPSTDMTVRVLRVGLRKEVKTYTVDHATLLRHDRDLEYGMRKVVQEGRDGMRRVVTKVRYVDGKAVARTVLATRWLRTPRARVIAIGSGYPGCVCNRGTQTGKATWYGEADGLTAAHPTLPFGTVVRVTNLANGRWVNVTIRDRGPYGDGRIIDLSDEAFRRIASLYTGVISVRIRW